MDGSTKNRWRVKNPGTSDDTSTTTGPNPYGSYFSDVFTNKSSAHTVQLTADADGSSVTETETCCQLKLQTAPANLEADDALHDEVSELM